MLQLTKVSKYFGARGVLNQVSLMVQGQDRIGLVGMNGSGKSTLLKMMGGVMPPDDRIVSLGRGETAGYLPQDGLVTDGSPLIGEVTGACGEVRACEIEIKDIERVLSFRATADGGVSRPAHVLSRLSAAALCGGGQEQSYDRYRVHRW